MGLAHSYTLLAPIYDLIVGRASRQWRRESLGGLGGMRDHKILLDGIGSGLDIPYLPVGPDYIGLDLTPAMLARARARAREEKFDIALHQGDAMLLPYADNVFDTVIMHLIVSVVTHSGRALAEAQRVLKPGGRIFILDKFLRPGQSAPLRRLISPLLGKVVTRTDVIFEELLFVCPQLMLVSDVALNPGWFRRIVLRKI